MISFWKRISRFYGSSTEPASADGPWSFPLHQSMESLISKGEGVSNAAFLDVFGSQGYFEERGNCSISHDLADGKSYDQKAPNSLGPLSEISAPKEPLVCFDDSEGANSMVYGELAILGFNGRTPNERFVTNKFILKRRLASNGLIPSRCPEVVDHAVQSKAFTDTERYSVSIVDNRARTTTVVEYIYDCNYDMFQIGRLDTSRMIDFPVVANKQGFCNESVSRFACRIVFRRSNPRDARLYAAGFDNSGNIFLGAKARNFCLPDGSRDGVITNGVHLKKPSGSWVEVSVRGHCLPSRADWKFSFKQPTEETNLLVDGSLIDLCGVTLIWRSAQSAKERVTRKLVEQAIEKLRQKEVICPVLYTTLVISGASHKPFDVTKHPVVYLQCGHVQGYHEWKGNQSLHKLKSGQWVCPMCRSVGSKARLRVGCEPAFYMDEKEPIFALSPCGHMVSEETARFWTSLEFTIDQTKSLCPFCAQEIRMEKPYVRLICEEAQKE